MSLPTPPRILSLETCHLGCIPPPHKHTVAYFLEQMGILSDLIHSCSLKVLKRMAEGAPPSDAQTPSEKHRVCHSQAPQTSCPSLELPPCCCRGLSMTPKPFCDSHPLSVILFRVQHCFLWEALPDTTNLVSPYANSSFWELGVCIFSRSVEILESFVFQLHP